MEESQTAYAMGPGGVPKGAKTSEYYRTKDIPDRFEHPGVINNEGNPVFSCPAETKEANQLSQNSDQFQGYTSKSAHPMYRTSNSEYGANGPSVHTVPTEFHARSQKFSENLGKCGMYRNHSLNCAADKSNV